MQCHGGHLGFQHWVWEVRILKVCFTFSSNWTHGEYWPVLKALCKSQKLSTSIYHHHILHYGSVCIVYSIVYTVYRQERLRQTCFVHTVWRLRRVCSLRQVHKEEPQVHYAPGFDLLAGFAKQTLQKLAYIAWHREVSNFLFWGPAKSVAFVNC